MDNNKPRWTAQLKQRDGEGVLPVLAVWETSKFSDYPSAKLRPELVEAVGRAYGVPPKTAAEKAGEVLDKLCGKDGAYFLNFRDWGAGPTKTRKDSTKIPF